MRKALLLAGAAMFAFVSAADAQTYYRGQRQNQYPQYNARTYSYGPTPQYYVPQPYGQQQQTYGIRPYIGLDYVYSNVGYSDIQTTIDNRPTEIPSSLMKDTNNSFSINLGLRFNQYIGAEVFYQQSDEQDKTTQVYYYGQMCDAEISTKFKAYGLDVIGYIPFTYNFEGLATIGVANYNFEGSLGKDFVGSDDEDGLGIRLGLGALYHLNNHIAIRLIGRYVTLENDWVDDMVDISAGIRYTF